MHRLAQLVLLFIHALYGLKNFVFSFVPRRNPKPLLARRRKLPAHIALLLVPDAENHDARVEESVMEECVDQMVEWCKKIGVERLSVYERDGVLSRKSIHASPALSQGLLLTLEETSLKPPRGPLTPPPSETDCSRPRSPDFECPVPGPTVNTFQFPYLSGEDAAENEKKVHRRHGHSHIFESKAHLETLTLHVLSRQSSKPTIAATARSLALTQAGLSPLKSSHPFNLTQDSLNDILEGESGLPPPGLVIVHSLYPTTAPLELHGFPPWQARLSQIYYAPRRGGVLRHLLQLLTPGRRRHTMTTALAISEIDFRRALDEYSGAEMRLGR